MPLTINHSLSATTPDNPAFEIRPSHWNSGHAATINAVGSEISGAFTNGNGISFGMSGASISASHNALTSQSNQALSAEGGSSAFQTLSFSNNAAVSFSNSNGQVVGSVVTTWAGSNHSHGNPTLNLTNLSGTTASNSAGLTLSLSAAAAQTVQTQSLIAAVYDGANSISTGTIRFTNANGVSFTVNGQTISGSVNTSYAASNHSHGNPTLNLTNLSGTTASNSAGLTLSLSALSQTNQSVGVYAVSNTTGAASSTTVDARSLSFQGAGVASVGMTNGSVVISVPAGGGAGDGGVGISAVNSSVSSGNVVFSNSNGVSFGLNGSTVTASHNGLTTAAASDHSHGNPTLALTNLSGTTASNSAGFTLSLSALAALTSQSNQNITAANGGFAFQTLSFSNLNGISFGTSAGSAITASHNAITTGRASTDAIGLNTAQTNVTWTVNSSGLSFNASGYAGTATAITGRASITLNSAGLSFNGSALAGTGTAITGNASITLNSSGLSFNGSGLAGTATAVTGAAAITLNSGGLSFNGASLAGTNTAVTGAASVTLNTSGLSFNGAALAGTTSGFTGANLSATITHNTAGLALSMSAAAPGAATITVSAVGNTTVNSSGTWPGALALRAYGVLSAGTSNGSLLLSTPDPVDFTYMSVGVSTGGNTAGDTGVFSQRVVFVGSNNITLSASSNGGSQTISVIGAAGGGVALYDGANSITSGTARFTNANGVSFTFNGQTISGSVNTSYAASNHSHGNPTLNLTNLSGTTASASNGLTLSLSAAAPQTGLSGIIVSDATYTSGTVSFSNQNGVTIGSSVNGGSQYIRLSVANQSVQTQSLVAAVYDGAASISTGTVRFTNANGVSFTINGQTISGSVNTSYAASNHSHGDPTLALTNLTGTTASNSAGFTLSLSALAALTSQSNQNVTAANGGFAFQTLSFSNVNGISFGTSAGSAITASHNAITTARASNDAIGLNTAQTNVTWTVNSSGLSLNAAGYAGTATAITGGAAITLNSAGLSFNGASLAGTSSGFTGVNISASITHNTAGFAMSASVAAPGAANESNNFNLLGANTAGNTTASGTTLGFSGINLTLSGTNNSVINISAPATSSLVGVNGISISTAGSTISVMPQWVSSYENMPGDINQTLSFDGASVSHAVAFNLPENISASYIRIPVLMTTNSTTIATTGATRNVSGAIYSTWNAVVYSLGTGASSRSLQSVASGSDGWTFMNSLSIAVNGTQYSVTQAFSANAEGADTVRTTQYSISNTNYSLTTNQIATEFSSGRYIDIPFANSLSAGPYWLVMGYSSSSATNSAGAWTNANVRYSNHFGASQTNMAFGVMGSTNLASMPLGAGSFSTAGGGTTASIPLSAISSQASHVRPYFQIVRQG